MSEVLDAIREKFPAYKDVLDDELTVAIGQKYPQYLERPDFKAEFDQARGVGVIPGAGVEGETGARPGPEMIPPKAAPKVTHLNLDQPVRIPRMGPQKGPASQIGAAIVNTAAGLVEGVVNEPATALAFGAGPAASAMRTVIGAQLIPSVPGDVYESAKALTQGNLQTSLEKAAIPALVAGAALAPKTAAALRETSDVAPRGTLAGEATQVQLGSEIPMPKGARPPMEAAPELYLNPPEQAAAQAKAMAREATAAYEPPKPPKPEVPATPPEPYETVLEAIRRAKADTTSKVQQLFPAAQLTRQAAAELRRLAFGQAKTTPPPAEPLLDRLQAALEKGDFAQIKKTAQKLAVFDEVPESVFKEPEAPKPAKTKPEAIQQAINVTESTAEGMAAWKKQEMAEMEKKGWDYKWPFVPADLMNKDFRDLIRSDPSLSAEEKAKILKFGPPEEPPTAPPEPPKTETPPVVPETKAPESETMAPKVETPNVQFEYPKPDTPEAAKIRQESDEASKAEDALIIKRDAIEQELKNTRSGTKKEETLQSKLEKARNAVWEESAKNKPLHERSRMMYLEHLAQTGDPAQRAAALPELLRRRAEIITKQADDLTGKDKQASYKLYDQARALGKQARELSDKAYQRLTQEVSETLQKEGATKEEADFEAGQIVNMQMSYPGMKSVAEAPLRMRAIQGDRVRKKIEAEGDALMKEYGVLHDDQLQNRLKMALPDEARAREVLERFRAQYKADKAEKDAKEKAKESALQEKQKAELETAKELKAQGKLHWKWVGNEEKSGFWQAVEGKPIQVPNDPNHAYFLSRSKGTSTVTEESTGLMVGVGKSQAEALQMASERISKMAKADYDKLVETHSSGRPEKPLGDLSIGPGARSPSDAPAAPPQARAAGAVHEQAAPEDRPLGPASPLAAKIHGFWQDLKTTIRGAAGDSMPKTTAADRETGEAGVRYASSKLAARPLAQRFVAQALEGTGVDPVKFGAALTEDNLVSIRESFRGEATRLLAEGKPDLAQEATESADKVATIIGAEGSPFRTQDELLDYLERPDVRQAVAQHAQLWQEIIDPQFRDAKGLDPDTPLPSRGQVTGARINLKAILADEDLQGFVKPVRASAPSLTATFKKKSPFTIKAKGTGESYDIDYNSIIANTFERQLEIANKNAFDKRLVETGNAVIDRPGQTVIIKGEPAVPFPLVRKVYVSGQGGEKKMFPMAQNIYVRKELAGEYRVASNVDPKFKIPYVTATMNLLNRSALAGLTDFTVHMSNQATALFNRPVSGKLLFDTLLSATGRADIPVTLVKTWLKAYQNNAAQIAELTEIGSMRPAMTHGWNPLGKILAHTDALTRLMLDDTFKSLAEDGLIENTETARREYANQIGQYNRRLQGPLTRLLRDTGFGPFVTAGKTFNAMGVKMVTLSPGVKGANLMAEAALRANVLSKWVGAAVMLGTLNYLLSGNVLGRPGTPLGSLDIGKNDRSGKQLSLPLLDLMGLGRGLRVTGVKGAYQSLRLGLKLGDAMDAAARDILNAWSAPALGPPARFGSELATGYPPALNVPRASRVVPPGGGQFGENLRAAVLDANPVVASVRKAIEGKTVPEILSTQLPRFTMVPGKTENLVANYPRIVTMAQGNAFIEDVIYQARRLPQEEKLPFIREQINRLPASLRNRAMSEIRRRRVMVVEKNAAKP